MCQQIENILDSQASAFDDRFPDHDTRIDSDATKKLLVSHSFTLRAAKLGNPEALSPDSEGSSNSTHGSAAERRYRKWTFLSLLETLSRRPEALVPAATMMST